RPAMYTCRECENEINQATEICPHCGVDLTIPPGETLIIRKPSLTRPLARWVVLLGILVAALWSFLWFVVSPRTGRVELEAETQAVQALGDVRAALNGYAAAQGGAFPQTLEPIGARARQAAQLAQSEGYQLQYEPGPPDSGGAIRTYALEARAGNFSYRSFYTDNSGVVRSTKENRAANGLDPPVQ